MKREIEPHFFTRITRAVKCRARRKKKIPQGVSAKNTLVPGGGVELEPFWGRERSGSPQAKS
jgi:hypothetical protein